MSTPPIIVLGMHRSGTTLLMQLFEDLGVFVGLRGGTNREAKLFKQVNKWIFAQLSATWDAPDNARFLFEPGFESHLDRVVLGQIRGFRIRRYLGYARALRYRDLRRIDFPWAWKDPRNVFTVGMWKKYFPDARIIHIYRHPLDVASSLMRREQKRLAKFRLTLTGRLSEHRLVREQRYCHSLRLLHPLEGVDLWRSYVGAGFENCAPFESDALSCCYEDLLARPVEVLGELVEFARLSASQEDLARVTSRINPARSLAFESDPEMVALTSQIADLPWVRKLGYAD